MHISVPIANTMEYINATEVSPLISKCQVKVCYVGQEPNRNNTVITKELAYELGRKLPGSPIVGYYNEQTKDFEGHNREVKIGNGSIRIVDTTKAYGFVPTNAKVWFQKFIDDGVERLYLVTECYIWTGAYPESKRIIDQGNNHSMELSKENQAGFWAEDDNSNGRIFIYNEALIEKLCILGEDVEPCFEGAQFKTEFSLENNPEFQEFKRTMFSMISKIQNTLNEGGSQGPMEENKVLEQNPENEFEKKKTPEQEEEQKKEAPASPSSKEEQKPEEKPAEDKKKDKKNYNLEEVTEYVELKAQYEDLQSKYSALEQDKANLEAEVGSLKEFKLQAEHKDKQSMIDSFYMLTDEDKQDVVEHIDTYSLDDIEAKLSVICVRNKVDFNLNKPQDQEEQGEGPSGLFELNKPEESTAPAWVKAVLETANKN